LTRPGDKSIRLMLVDLERVPRKVLQALREVAPLHIAVARRTVVANPEHIVKMGADATRTQAVQPRMADDEAQPVQHLRVAHIMPVARLFERQSIEKHVVLRWLRDFVEVVAVFEPNSDAVRLAGV